MRHSRARQEHDVAGCTRPREQGHEPLQGSLVDEVRVAQRGGTGCQSASIAAFWTSTGIDRWLGCRRAKAWVTACRRWWGTTAGDETDTDSPVTGLSASMSSMAAPEASWNAPSPSHERATSPLIASTALRSAPAAASAVVMLSTPGPPIPKHTPSPPEARA